MIGRWFGSFIASRIITAKRKAPLYAIYGVYRLAQAVAESSASTEKEVVPDYSSWLIPESKRIDQAVNLEDVLRQNIICIEAAKTEAIREEKAKQIRDQQFRTPAASARMSARQMRWEAENTLVLETKRLQEVERLRNERNIRMRRRSHIVFTIIIVLLCALLTFYMFKR